MLETHSKHVLLCAEALFGLEIPSFHKQERAKVSKLGPSGPEDDLTNSTNQESGSRLLAKDTLLSDGTLAPIGIFS